MAETPLIVPLARSLRQNSSSGFCADWRRHSAAIHAARFALTCISADNDGPGFGAHRLSLDGPLARRMQRCFEHSRLLRRRYSFRRWKLGETRGAPTYRRPK